MAGMNCPESERIAAYAEGRLDAAEEAQLLEHASECDDCRRELAVLMLLPRETASSLPAGIRRRALKSVLRAGERSLRPVRRFHPERSPGFGAVAAAALLLIGFAGVLILFVSGGSPPAPMVQSSRPAAPIPFPAVPVKQEQVAAPPVAPSRAVEAPVLAPRPAPAPVPEEKKADPAPESVVLEPLPPPGEERKTGDSPRPSTHAVAPRVLSELQVTDVTGSLTVRRKGSKTSEKLGGVAKLGEGDVVLAEKPSSFHVEGRHPVVLGENTSVSLAYVAADEAPYLHLRSGEAMVDSTGPTRWIVTDGKVALVVKQARARFSVTPDGDRLAVAALSEPLFVQPDGGEIHPVRPGEELRVGRAGADVVPLDPQAAQRKQTAFDASRPRQKTVFYTSCDPADGRREHFFIQEGGYFRNEALLSAARPDKSAAVVLSPNPRFAWRPNLVLRGRIRTNATQLTVSFRVEERKYTLFRTVAVDRKGVNQWIPLEIPIVPSALQFRRDDGQSQLVVTGEDRFDSLRFTADQRDVFGDQRVTFLVDDIQVVERE